MTGLLTGPGSRHFQALNTFITARHHRCHQFTAALRGHHVPQDHDSAIGTSDTSLADTANIGVDDHVSGQHQEVQQDPPTLTVNHSVLTIETIDPSALTLDPSVLPVDPSVLTVEENYNRAPSSDKFGNPPLPNLVSSRWNEFDSLFNQYGFNQPEPQPAPTPLIDFELSSADDLEQGGKSQTEKENNQEGRDQEQDRNEHISHGRNVGCTDSASGGENCQNNQSEDTQNIEGLGQSPRIREEARGSVEPSLDLASQETSLSTPKGKEDIVDVSSGTADKQTRTIQEEQPSPSNPAPTKKKTQAGRMAGFGQNS